MITKIENYYLGQPVNEAPNLIEFTDEDYRIFEISGWVKTFEDERIYDGEKVNLNDNLWNTTIGITNGKIFNISLQIMDADKKRISYIFKSTLMYMINKIGRTYNEHPFLSKNYIWNTPEGIIIFQQLNKLGIYCINIIITSNSIREQMQDYVSKH